MNQYLLLQHPGHNRAYYTSSGQLALAELTIACNRLSVAVYDIESIEIAQIKYLSFKTDGTLSDDDWATLSRLSFVFALFRAHDSHGNALLLEPVEKLGYEYVDPKIGTLQKYQGKTNELFTKMMINVALLSSDFDYADQIKLLDPVAGKGTTLYEGMVYGMQVAGVELESKSVQAVNLFFKKYLETERYKHTVDTRLLHGSKKKDAVYVTDYEYATDKEAFKSEQLRKRLSIANGDSQCIAQYFKKQEFHIIVGDLPYGVAHANSSGKQFKSQSRNPSDMLHACLPQWKEVLKIGGVAVIAWNSFVVAKNKLRSIAAEYGFEVLDGGAYDQFEHMVDKSIKRDILILKRQE